MIWGYMLQLRRNIMIDGTNDNKDKEYLCKLVIASPGMYNFYK